MKRLGEVRTLRNSRPEMPLQEEEEKVKANFRPLACEASNDSEALVLLH